MANIRTGSFSERLTSLMKSRNISIQHLSDHLNVSYEMVRRYTIGTAAPRKGKVEIIAKLLKTTPEYLEFGIESKGLSNVVPANMGTRKIPIISYVQAGTWTGIQDLKDTTGDYQYILTDNEVSDDAFALYVRGESMLPEFREGDSLIIDPHEEPRAGEFVVAVNGDHEATFKKYCEDGIDQYGRHHFVLVALNPDFKYQMSSREQDIRIIGTMVEHRIYRRKR